jgi:8-oxo-dGTP pyrophosphatase MutT (NUDIX family)
MRFAAHFSAMTTAVTRPAASVILLRDEPTVQALLIRRHANLAFAGGTWVFPGGKVEPADADVALRAAPTEDTIRASIVAACRETFEEVGILLARHPNGDPCRPELVQALQPVRAEISRDADRFGALLQAHDLMLDASDFMLWSHWITPSIVPRRFDTYFFLARMPADQVVQCDSAEATELFWLDIQAGKDLPHERLIPAPPTRFSLAHLAVALEHTTLEALFESESARHVAPMMPKMLKQDGRIVVLMPWDAEYHSVAGEGTPPGAVIPDLYRNFPSRVFPSPETAGLPPG